MEAPANEGLPKTADEMFAAVDQVEVYRQMTVVIVLIDSAILMLNEVPGRAWPDPTIRRAVGDAVRRLRTARKRAKIVRAKAEARIEEKP